MKNTEKATNHIIGLGKEKLETFMGRKIYPGFDLEVAAELLAYFADNNVYVRGIKAKLVEDGRNCEIEYTARTPRTDWVTITQRVSNH
jgi:hypothetical protein